MLAGSYWTDFFPEGKYFSGKSKQLNDNEGVNCVTLRLLHILFRHSM